MKGCEGLEKPFIMIKYYILMCYTVFMKGEGLTNEFIDNYYGYYLSISGSANDNGHIYNLQGQQVTAPMKGHQFGSRRDLI